MYAKRSVTLHNTFFQTNRDRSQRQKKKEKKRETKLSALSARRLTAPLDVRASIVIRLVFSAILLCLNVNLVNSCLCEAPRAGLERIIINPSICNNCCGHLRVCGWVGGGGRGRRGGGVYPGVPGDFYEPACSCSCTKTMAYRPLHEIGKERPALTPVTEILCFTLFNQRTIFYFNAVEPRFNDMPRER